MGRFEFSQSYNSFYDQLEKANLFLQSIIDKANKPMSDPTVDWLFRNPISDGGTFTGVQDVISKYGVVPAEVMPESYNANNTSAMAKVIALKLREYGLALRKAYAAANVAKNSRRARLNNSLPSTASSWHVLANLPRSSPTPSAMHKASPSAPTPILHKSSIAVL